MHFQKSKLEIALVQKVFKGKLLSKSFKNIQNFFPLFFHTNTTPNLHDIVKLAQMAENVSISIRNCMKMLQLFNVLHDIV